MGDFLLVEQQVQGKKNRPKPSDPVFFVAKLLAIEEASLSMSFLRMKSVFTKDTFAFPEVEDIMSVERTLCKGVLVPTVGLTARQSSLIKIFPPLTAFDMR